MERFKSFWKKLIGRGLGDTWGGSERGAGEGRVRSPMTA